MVIATIAIGTATLATTFGVVNAALFREPPFADAGQIALLFIQGNERGEPPRQEPRVLRMCVSCRWTSD